LCLSSMFTYGMICLLFSGLQVPFEVRNHNGDQHGRPGGSLELIKVKILALGPDELPSSIRLEMSSEVDLFFHYLHYVDERSFSKIQEAQKLMVDLSDYPAILVRMLNACIKEPHVNLGIFTMLNDTDARLDFIQNMEYKFVELMYCVCVRSPEEVIQQHITFRYNSMKQKLSVMQSRLSEIHNLVKVKNPSLLLQLQKSSALPTTHTLASPTYGAGGGNAGFMATHGSLASSAGAGSIGVFQKPFR
jgi:hypothetical protein